MKATPLYLAVLSCFAVVASGVPPLPESGASKCPVGFEQVDVSYNHSGGQSVPQLRLAFSNRTDRTIADFMFALSILDSDGNPVRYPSDFTYRRDFPAGAPERSHLWKLDPASIDIHRSGETVTLLETRFADGAAWKDDGSRACALTFDYHAK